MWRTMRVLPALIIGVAVWGVAVWSPAQAKVNLPANYGKLPLSFEPNRGQAPPDALYIARGNSYLLSLTAQGARLQLHQKGKSAQLSSHLMGARRSSRLEALDPLPGQSNYFRGQDQSKWIRGVPNFARVRSAGVYPGIDLIYYGNQS